MITEFKIHKAWESPIESSSQQYGLIPDFRATLSADTSTITSHACLNITGNNWLPRLLSLPLTRIQCFLHMAATLTYLNTHLVPFFKWPMASWGALKAWLGLCLPLWTHLTYLGPLRLILITSPNLSSWEPEADSCTTRRLLPAFSHGFCFLQLRSHSSVTSANSPPLVTLQVQPSPLLILPCRFSFSSQYFSLTKVLCLYIHILIFLSVCL